MFISIIIGIVIFYKVIIPFIHNQYHSSTEKRITKGLLSMSFWQILFGSLVCVYALQVEPVYKQTDEDVSSFVQEYSIVGDLVNEYTGINATSNFNYLMSEADSLHTSAIIFIIITVVFSLATVIGSIGRKLDRRIIEGLAILNTLACCWICKSSTDLYEMIIRDGVTLQTIAWIGRLLGTDIYSTMDLIIRSVWILPLILIIKHFYYHKTLDEYYAWVVPQSRSIKQQEENKVQEQSSPQTAAGSINPIEYSNTPTEENNPEFVTGDISSTNQQSEVIKSQDETITSSDIQESTLQTNENVCNDSIKASVKKESKSSYIGFAIGGIAIIIIAVFVVWQCTKDEDVIPTLQQEEMNTVTGATQQQSTQSTSDIYEQRSNAIIQELTAKYGNKIQVDHRYPELSRYCTFRLKGEDDYGFPYLLIYDLDKGKLKQFNTEALPTNNVGEVLLTSYDVLINQENNTLLISGNNGANSVGYIEYILELNPSNWQIRELCSGRAITKNDDRYIAHRMIMTKFIDCTATSEFALVDIHYDLQGRLIAPSYNGSTYGLKGRINDKYAVTMQLSIQDDKIYGKYFYDKTGSDNYLYLYGGISESGDVVLLEFNNKGEQTSDFMGRFTNDSFYGTFTNYKQVKMPFELHLNDGTSKANSSRPVSNNSEQTDNSEVVEEALTSDRDPEFPGGMSNLRKYISENVEYPTISQENGIAGQVKVSYIINEDGSISDVEVIESVDPYLDKEAIRVISLMPKWSPGIRNGKYVKMKTSTYVKFSLH
ncbi:MAG: energy transducer TonB [Phocaeicola dorei]|nr:energy transducer TonB [Phocaeicola dorei]